MNPITIKFIIAGILFLITAASGIWLKLTGSPYSGFLVTAHKLVSLAAVVFTVMAVYHLQKSSEFNTIQWFLIGMTAIFLLVALISGGLLTVENISIKIPLLLHRITSVLSLLCGIVMVYYFYR
jgi:hypothetical protein